LALMLALAMPAGAADEELRTIPSRPGVTESLLLLRPTRPPVATVILLAGGDGVVALTPAGPSRLQGNFLLRTRQRFAAEGLLVAVLDSPSDRTSLWNFRTTADHAADLRAAIAALREIAAVPVWLVGTSMGTLSAANAAARLNEGGPDGIVLTSSVSEISRVSGESIRHVPLGDIRVPVLIVHHRHDTCRSSPYAWAADAPKALKRAPAKELLTYEGGEPTDLGALRGEVGPWLPGPRGAGRGRHRGLDPRPLIARAPRLRTWAAGPGGCGECARGYRALARARSRSAPRAARPPSG
jgi:pimeloyl-ACP methyl ester carboxylesterase